MANKITCKSVLTAPPNMKMPVIGLGTWQASEDEVETALNAALEVGYRHIDTAFVYMNEAAVGKTLKKWIDSGKIKREELFVATKLPITGLNEKYVEEFLTKSLTNLQLSYVDLYMIHYPAGLVYGEGLIPRDEKGNLKIDMSTDHVAVWRAMEAQVDAGRTKAIGVANFNSDQIDRILRIARIPPANNQVELHVYCQQKPLREWARRTGVTICAYAPLGSPTMAQFVEKRGGSAEGIKDLHPLTDPVVARIAKAHNRSAAQVLLRHLIQLGLAVIPKSRNPERVRLNFQVFDFELSDAEMTELNALDKGEDGRRFIGGLLKGMEVHPEFPFKH